jgi:type IV secretion system protein VirB10
MNKPFLGRPSEPGRDFDIRPSVAIQKRDRSGWWFAGTTMIAAALLFSALEARRRGVAQAISPSWSGSSLATPEAIPDLVMPENPSEHDLAQAIPQGWPVPYAQPIKQSQSMALPSDRPAFSQPIATARSNSEYPDRHPASVNMAPLLVTGQPGPAASSFEGPQNQTAQIPKSERVLAGRLENPETTVVQGTMISAVLETALDSTRPGQARAMVTQNVFGFDGTHMLIPRGTRLYGVYEADVAQGQNRAQITWTRLLRPDGVSVALDSPAADPLGRAGVEGSVNNHFGQRLGNALLSTTANLGSALATRSIAPSSPVVVAVPGAAQSTTQALAPASREIAPTLTVRQGARISVFVQHDLDFSTVEATQ